MLCSDASVEKSEKDRIDIGPDADSGVPKSKRVPALDENVKHIFDKEREAVPMSCHCVLSLSELVCASLQQEVDKIAGRWDRIIYVTKHSVDDDRISIYIENRKALFDTLLGSSSQLVLIPTRRDVTDTTSAPGYLKKVSQPHRVVLIVEADSFIKGSFSSVYEDENIFFLILPPPRKLPNTEEFGRTRGVGFARQVSLTVAQWIRQESNQRLKGIFYLDDDVTELRTFKKEAGKTKILDWSVAMTAMIELCARFEVAVVGTRSERHKQHGLADTYISRSTQIDFRFVYLDLARCARRASFQTKFVRTMPFKKIQAWWQTMKLEKEHDNCHSWVQNVFFQGEDFCFCNQLAHSNDGKSLSLMINNLVAHTSRVPSRAGTMKQIDHLAETQLEIERGNEYAEGARAFDRMCGCDRGEVTVDASDVKKVDKVYVSRCSEYVGKFHRTSRCGVATSMKRVDRKSALVKGYKPCRNCMKQGVAGNNIVP
jgi:hypothetical protein